jgi:hypothetical protein
MVQPGKYALDASPLQYSVTHEIRRPLAKLASARTFLSYTISKEPFLQLQDRDVLSIDHSRNRSLDLALVTHSLSDGHEQVGDRFGDMLLSDFD